MGHINAARWIATSCLLTALHAPAAAQAQKLGKPKTAKINLECVRPDSAKYLLNIDIRAETIRYRLVDANGTTGAWLGPLSVVATHSDGSISWHSSEQDWRTQWILNPARNYLTVASATGGGCCAKSPLQWKSFEAHCSATKTNVSRR